MSEEEDWGSKNAKGCLWGIVFAGLAWLAIAIAIVGVFQQK